MSNQIDFIFGTSEEPATELERAFWQFHRNNPEVYELFDLFTRRVIARGWPNFGVSVIVERIRWETTVETDTCDQFKINNNHRAYYARLWMRNNPGHAGFFHTRRTHGVTAALACRADNDNAPKDQAA